MRKRIQFAVGLLVLTSLSGCQSRTSSAFANQFRSALSLRRGQPAAEVRDHLGNPTEVITVKSQMGGEVWVYSDPVDKQNFIIIKIINNVVVGGFVDYRGNVKAFAK